MNVPSWLGAVCLTRLAMRKVQMPFQACKACKLEPCYWLAEFVNARELYAGIAGIGWYFMIAWIFADAHFLYDL